MDARLSQRFAPLAVFLLLCLSAAGARQQRQPARGARPPQGPVLQAVIVSLPDGAAGTRDGRPLAGLAKGAVLRDGDVLTVGPAGDMEVRIATLGIVRVKANSILRLT